MTFDIQAEFTSECETIEWLSDNRHSDSNQRTSVACNHFTSHNRHLTVNKDKQRKHYEKM